MNLGTAQVIRGDARHLPLADNTVDLVVTSPPYFALRSYQDAGEHYAGQLGSEPTPAEFVDALIEVTAECVRVLKPSGSLWVNLGDKYASHSGGNPAPTLHANGKRATLYERGSGAWKHETIRAKSLIGIPWRYALRCIDDLGLILRAEVIWSKPNGLPESVTDRVRRSHEQWFHFTLEPRYFSAVDEIREEYAPGDQARSTLSDRRAAKVAPMSGGINPHTSGNPLGKLPGSVWTIPTEPLTVPDHLGIDHFAAFPTEWPRRIIQGWSPAGVCVECGEGRRPVAEHTEEWAAYKAENGLGDYMANGKQDIQALGARRSQTTIPIPVGGKHRITGYACACPHPTADTTPAVVLDPFGGTGTTALVAKALGRHGITVDMSADYCRLAAWRTNDRNQLAKVLGIAKAEQQPADQLDLFAEESA